MLPSFLVAEDGAPLAGSAGVDLREVVAARADAREVLRSRSGSFVHAVGSGAERRHWRLSARPDGGVVRIDAQALDPEWPRGHVARANEALRAADGVGHLLLDGDGAVVWIDEAAGAVLGREDPLGLPLSAELSAAARDSLARGEGSSGSLLLRHPDGTQRVVEHSLLPLGVDALVAMAVRDVTVAREVEKLQNLDSAMSTVSRVIADAAHGVNNLAARMIALCERAARDDDPASVGPALTGLQALAVQLGDIGREMLWVATPGATAGPSDLGRIGVELGRFLRRAAGSEGPPVEVRAPEGVYVASAPDVFIRAASHFALRAIDVARGSASPLALEVSTSSGRGMLRLRYRGGQGEYALLRQVLDHAAGSEHPLVHGREDGVSLRLLAPIEAQVTVEISAPLVQPASPSGGNSLSGRSGPRGRLLVADDEPDLRDLYADVLSPMFSEVIKVGDGQAAWEWLEAMQGQFALVVLDLRMPRMDGMDVLHRAHARWPELRVIVVSGAAPDGVIQSAMAEGARHVLTKPFTIRELRAVVRAALADP